MSSHRPAAALLDVRGVSRRFGGLTAVKDLQLKVERGTLYGLIGPNGAGKTTVFNLLTGVYAPSEGEIWFDGRHIHGHRPYQIATQGIARTFQNIRLFADMTVLENVMTAQHLRTSQMIADAIFGSGRHHREEQETRDRALHLLSIFGLEALADELVDHGRGHAPGFTGVGIGVGTGHAIQPREGLRLG
jgi:branched-chain amino acid transport system ATP-binding protein